jgi:hypothetical protein
MPGAGGRRGDGALGFTLTGTATVLAKRGLLTACEEAVIGGGGSAQMQRHRWIVQTVARAPHSPDYQAPLASGAPISTLVGAQVATADR